jgi:deoxyribonuclease-4
VLVGAHVSTTGGIHTAIDRAEERGCEAVQLFTQSPRAWRPTNHPAENLARFRERRAEAGVGAVVCHALYLINLATPDEALWEKSRATLLHTVGVACAIEADGVVLHVGSHLGAGLEAGVERAVPALEEALAACGDTTWILLENSAGAGGTIGRSVEELALLVDRLEGHPRLGICLDSCHLWVSGTDVTDPDVLDRTVREVDAGIGLDRLRCLHVNDTPSPLGSNRDRHANVGEGVLGEQLGVFLAHPRLQGLPAILETPGPGGHGGPDAAEVRRLKELHARWAPATRPGRSARRPGRTASRGGARRTRG